MFFKKKLHMPVSSDVKETETIQLWIVNWYSRYGPYGHDIKKEYEAFTDEQEAETFKKSLEAAFKLIRTTSHATVTITKN